MKTSYDKRVKVVPYEPGQFVYVWRPRPPHNKNKFFNNYFGPFKILKKVTDYTYKLDIGSKSRMYDIVPHDLLRPASCQAGSKPNKTEYDPLKLDLNHRLEIIPESDEYQQQIDSDQPLDRPVTIIDQPQQIQPAQPQGWHGQLRDRNLIRAPQYYQA